jgi:hypothetical protein
MPLPRPCLGSRPITGSAILKHLAEQHSKVSGEKLSKATLHATLAHLKRFFQWLVGQPGYKSPLRCSDGDPRDLSRSVSIRRPALFQSAQPAQYASPARRDRVQDPGGVQGMEPESWARGSFDDVPQLWCGRHPAAESDHPRSREAAAT